MSEDRVSAIAAAGPEAVAGRIDTNLIDSPALTQAQVLDSYNLWSSTYEADLSRVPHGYNNPRQLADLFVALLSPQPCVEARQCLRVLDVACGTGLVGECLRERGFRRVDGVDGSARMLEVARSKCVYENLFVELIGDQPLRCAQPRTYDALLTTGSFCPNHLAPSCLKHLAALVKPGGLVGIGMRKEFGITDPVLRGIEPELLRLQSDGTWQLLAREERECYYGEQPGVFYVMRLA